MRRGAGGEEGLGARLSFYAPSNGARGRSRNHSRTLPYHQGELRMVTPLTATYEGTLRLGSPPLAAGTHPLHIGVPSCVPSSWSPRPSWPAPPLLSLRRPQSRRSSGR